MNIQPCSLFPKIIGGLPRHTVSPSLAHGINDALLRALRRLRHINVPIHGTRTSLELIGGEKISDLLRGDGTEGGALFYHDPKTQIPFVLKFFHGHVLNEQPRALRRLNQEKGPFRNDLENLLKGMPMVRWLSDRDGASNGPHPLLPVLDWGFLGRPDEPFYRIRSRSRDRNPAILKELSAGQIPYVIQPFIIQGAQFALAPAPGHYCDAALLSSLSETTVESASWQNAVAAPFRGKSKEALAAMVKQKILTARKEILARERIALWDDEPMIDLARGTLVILDTGMSIPLPDPLPQFRGFVAQLFDLNNARTEHLFRSYQKHRKHEAIMYLLQLTGRV